MARRFPGKLAIARPCHVGDEALEHEAKGDYCLSCQKVVHDFSSLSYAEAVELVGAAKSEGRKLCGTIHVRADGAVLLADGYVHPESLAKRRLPTILAVGAIGLAACAAPEPVAVPVLAPPPPTSEPIAPPPAIPAPVAAAPEPSPIAIPPQPEAEPEPPPPAPPPITARVKNPPKPPPPLKGGHTTKPPALRGDMAL